MTDQTPLDPLTTETTRYLIGDLGIQILSLVDQGCTNDDDLIKFGRFSRQCLSVKIPLLTTLGLLAAGPNGYRITPTGQSFLDTILRWSQ